MKTEIENVDRMVNKTVGQNGQVYVGKDLADKDVKIAVVVKDE